MIDKKPCWLFTRHLFLLTIIFLYIPINASTQVLEEIVVTAQKRVQNIQDVGIAVSALSGEQLSALGFIESTEIAAMTPGVHVSASSAGQTRQFTIRGVTQNDFSDHTEAPNAVYIDEGYLVAPQGQVFGLFDLERVEVLKGPQGTLFGRNATGGLAHFITRKPTRDSSGFADVTYGSYDQVRFEGAVGGPLGDTLAGRLSLLYNRHDEIMDNHFPLYQAIDPLSGLPLAGSRAGADDVGNDDQWAIRGQLLWDINEDTEFLLSGFYSRQDVSTAPYQSVGTTAVVVPVGPGQNLHVDSIFSRNDPRNCEAIDANTGACVPLAFVDGEIPGVNEDGIRPRPGGDLYGYIDPDGEDFDTSMDHALDDFNEYEVRGATGKLSWESAGFTLTSVSHYMNFKKLQTLDAEAAPVPQFIFMADSEHDSFSQELRLHGESDRLRWVAGAYFLYIDTQFETGLAFPPASPFTTIFFGGLPIESDVLVDLQTESYSLFGQVDYDITDKLTLVAGLRIVQEEKEYDYENQLFLNTDDALLETGGAPLPFGLEYPAFSGDTSQTLWTGKLQLEFRPTEDLLFYGGVNRGVKAGSFNAKLNELATAPLPTEEIPYDEEVLLAYEVGFKSTLFNGTTRFNGSFYYYDYDDYQAFVFQLSSGVIRNANATYKGMELELVTNPVDNLDLFMSVSLLDAEVKDLEVAPGIFHDVEPSFTPSVQLAGLARYEWPGQLFNGTLAIQLDANYASSAFHNIRNFQSHKMPDYVVGNARISWLSGDRRWEGSFFVRNFTDSRYKITGFELATACGCTEEGYGMPRWFGGRLRYNWN